jgi:hypothetical protein
MSSEQKLQHFWCPRTVLGHKRQTSKRPLKPSLSHQDADSTWNRAPSVTTRTILNWTPLDFCTIFPLNDASPNTHDIVRYKTQITRTKVFQIPLTLRRAEKIQCWAFFWRVLFSHRQAASKIENTDTIARYTCKAQRLLLKVRKNSLQTCSASVSALVCVKQPLQKPLHRTFSFPTLATTDFLVSIA